MKPLSSSASVQASERRRRWTAGARLSAWVALLLVEGLALGVRFDSESLARLPHGWWSALLAVAGFAMPAATTVLAGLLLIEWARGRATALQNLADGFRFGHRTGPHVAAQAASFAVLYGVSTALFDESAAPTSIAVRHTGALVALWLGAAAATFVTWLHVLVPLRRVPSLAREHAPPLVGACVLGGVAYFVGRLSQGLWLPLRHVTFVAATWGLRAFVREPFVDITTFTLGTGRFQVEIAPACSGYEGIGLTCVFVAAALWLFRERLRFPRAFVLFGLATLVPWTANVLRIVALIVIGTYVSPDMAAGAFHSYAGAILFCAIALGLVAFALRSPAFSDVANHDTAPNPVAPYLVPFLAMIAAGLVSRAFSDNGHEPLWAFRPLAGLVALLVYLPAYRRLATGPALARAADPAEAQEVRDPRAVHTRPHTRPHARPIDAFAVLVGLLVAAIWLGVELTTGPGFVSRAFGGSAASLAARIATALILVPVAEELAFRGFLARRISARAFDELPPQQISLVGVVVSSALFGLLHQRPLVGGVAGLGYALAFRRRGRLADAVTAHALTNAVLVLVACLTGAWDLWL